MGDLPKLPTVTIYVPGKHDAGTVLKRLTWQNPGLKVDTWQVKGSKEVPAKKSDLGVETAVRVTIEPTEVEALKCIDFLPYCEQYGSGHPCLRQGRKAGQGRRAFR